MYNVYIRARAQWRAFGGAVAMAGRRAGSVCMLASVERPASSVDTLIQTRVFVMHATRPINMSGH